jgi:hypothetical protein
VSDSSPLDRAIAILSGQLQPSPMLALVLLAMGEREQERVLLKLRSFVGEAGDSMRHHK